MTFIHRYIMITIAAVGLVITPGFTAHAVIIDDTGLVGGSGVDVENNMTEVDALEVGEVGDEEVEDEEIRDEEVEDEEIEDEEIEDEEIEDEEIEDEEIGDEE